MANKRRKKEIEFYDVDTYLPIKNEGTENELLTLTLCASIILSFCT